MEWPWQQLFDMGRRAQREGGLLGDFRLLCNMCLKVPFGQEGRLSLICSMTQQL